MPVHNADITAIFEEIAKLLEIQGANTFRIRSYRNAARILDNLPQSQWGHMGTGCHVTEIGL